MASFLGVSASGFPLDVALGRTNSQSSTGHRGVDTVQRDPVRIGVYEISGNRPMLCATRRAIYSKTQDVCRVLNSSFAVHYDACLGGSTSKCVDKGMQTDPARAVTTMALPLNSFPASMEEAPSNLIVVGGFAKCSSSHVFRILQSHPNTVTFGKQVGSLAGQEVEFEMAAFAIARTLQIPGKPVISACTGMPLRALKECNRLVGWIRGRYDNSTAAVLVITDIFFLEKKALAHRWTGKVKLLFVVREPADYLWAAYNFWILPGERKGLQNDWTDMTTHTRSPELFHDLVVADGKMPAWQPRSDKVTGLWFNLIQDVKNASATILVLKSEAAKPFIADLP
ncbi:unnamed protein product, partial [Symbiodinium sp. CCMP2456]